MIATVSTENYLSIVESAIDILKKSPEASDVTMELVGRILEIQANLNEKFFCTRSFSILCYRENEAQFALSDINAFVDSVYVWVNFIREILAMSNTKNNQLDFTFYSLMTYFSVSDAESIALDMTTNLKNLPEQYLNYICEWYSTRDYLWKSLDVNTENYELISDRVSTIKKYENEFVWLYERFADSRSKTVLFNILKNWLTFMPLKDNDSSYSEYRDFDLINSVNGTIVDCGAYIGDSAIAFNEAYPNCGEIYCFEAVPENYSALVSNTKIFNNVTCIQKAVGETYGTLSIGNEDLSASLIKGGDILVDVVPIDEEIKEKIDLVKMDIEGAEQSAIKGMQQHILSDRPRMIICTYHGNHDIIEIPLLIDSIRDDYSLYMRYAGEEGPIPIDFSLYAI